MTNPISPQKQEEMSNRLRQLGIREEDLTERFVKAGGPGGQKVNKSASAVFLRHDPSGIEVKAQQGRSQANNRFFARRLLADRYEAEVLGRKTERDAARAKARKQKRRRRRRNKTGEPQTQPVEAGDEEGARSKPDGQGE